MDSESLEISPHRRHAARFVELPSKEKAPGHSMRSLAFDNLASFGRENFDLPWGSARMTGEYSDVPLKSSIVFSTILMLPRIAY